MNSTFELRSTSEDGVTVELYFSDKSLDETLEVIKKFLIASGYQIDNDSMLLFIAEKNQYNSQPPQEFTAKSLV